jgi:hypothetical protein
MQRLKAGVDATSRILQPNENIELGAQGRLGASSRSPADQAKFDAVVELIRSGTLTPAQTDAVVAELKTMEPTLARGAVAPMSPEQLGFQPLTAEMGQRLGPLTALRDRAAADVAKFGPLADEARANLEQRSAGLAGSRLGAATAAEQAAGRIPPSEGLLRAGQRIAEPGRRRRPQRLVWCLGRLCWLICRRGQTRRSPMLPPPSMRLRPRRSRPARR